MPPVLAIKLFLPRFASNSLYLQYALRVLEERPIAQTFFYVPQIVQGLRTDPEGGSFVTVHIQDIHSLSAEYIERFVFEAASVSQLFCHQIIWNMKANCFKDDNAEIVRLLHTRGVSDVVPFLTHVRSLWSLFRPTQ